MPQTRQTQFLLVEPAAAAAVEDGDGESSLVV